MTRTYVSRYVRPDEHFARLLEVSSPKAAAADPAMGSLATVANALRAAGRVTGPAAPDQDFRVALRQRLVAVATVQAAEPAIARSRVHAGARATVGYRMQRRIAALAGTVAIATSLAGVGVAAARSLPGNPFYSIKRGTEAVQLWAAHGDVAKGKRHLEFARTRLAEARALPAGSSHIASTLDAMNSQTTAGSQELISAYRSSKSLAPLAYLVTFTHEQYADLVSLAATLPAAIRAQDVKSILLLSGVVNQVKAVSNNACILCASAGGTPSGGHLSTPPTSPAIQPTVQPSTSGSGGPAPGVSPSSIPRTSRRPGPIHTSLIPTAPPTTPLPKLPTLPTKPPTTLPTTLPTLLHHKHPHTSAPPLPVGSTLGL